VARQILVKQRTECSPCICQPGMIFHSQHSWLIQRNNFAARDVCKCKSGIGAANVSNGYAHASCPQGETGVICLLSGCCIVQ
jgi:hypothetical protein